MLSSLLHCRWPYPKASSLSVVVGEHSHKSSAEVNQRTVQVKAIHNHPKYTGDVSDGYDVSLLELSSPLIYNEDVQPICIPHNDVADGTMCIASGWGTTSCKLGFVGVYRIWG